MDKALFNDLLTGLNEMVEIENGIKQANTDAVHVHRIPDVKKIRSTTCLKQQEFAEALGVSLALVQSWETLRRIPSGSARKLLLMLELKPDLISALRVI